MPSTADFRIRNNPRPGCNAASVLPPLGARLTGEKLSAPIVLLGLLGVAALALTVLAIVTTTQWALLRLAIVIVALWAGTTLRHGIAAR